MNKNAKLGTMIALSIAMLGATIAVTYGAQQLEAAPAIFCYVKNLAGGGTTNLCIFEKKSDCKEQSLVDPESAFPGECFNQNRIK